MKPYKNLYESVCDFENLYRSYIEASRHKRFRDESLLYGANLEENLIVLQNELLHQSYQVGAYEERYIYEKKRRLIMALPFKDRVAQWALYRIINPIYSRSYIEDSFGCVQGKGPQSAAKRAQYWVRLLEKKHGRAYYLKLDISKFFYRVDHEKLLEILGRKIDDDRLMRLFGLIIKSEDQPFGLPQGYNPGEHPLIFHKGMPVGNLTSQMFANVYMNEVDQYAKRELRIKHYIRYMDDIVIFSDNKKALHEYRDLLEQFLADRLRLDLNEKTVIRPTTLGLEFCGYKIWSTHMTLRKSTALHMKRRLKKIQRLCAEGRIPLDRALRTVSSYRGMMQHCNSYRLRAAIFGEHYADSPGWFSLKRNTPDETAVE